MRGGNITDIPQYEAISLISKFWSSDIWPQYVDSTASNTVATIVGDIHGDLHQLLGAIVPCGMITLDGTVDTIDDHIHFHIPHFTVNPSNTHWVILLGDYIDEWIFSRQVVHMIRLIKESIIGNYLRPLIGNHDTAIIGRYHLFKSGKLDIARDLPTLWETVRKELRWRSDITFSNRSVYLNGDEKEGAAFLHRYLEPLFEDMYVFFTTPMVNVMETIRYNDYRYMCSHTFVTVTDYIELFRKHDANPNAVREGDREPSQSEIANTREQYDEAKKWLNDEDAKAVQEMLKYAKESIDRMHSEKPNMDCSGSQSCGIGPIPIDMEMDENMRDRVHTVYEKMASTANLLYLMQSRAYVSRNGLTSSRNPEYVFLNQIVGHTIGGQYRELGYNMGPSKLGMERYEKIADPDCINNCVVYHLDFGASAGYDHDEVSRPDALVLMQDGSSYTTNMPAFSFVVDVDEDGKERHAMMILKEKTLKSMFKMKLAFGSDAVEDMRKRSRRMNGGSESECEDVSWSEWSESSDVSVSEYYDESDEMSG